MENFRIYVFRRDPKLILGKPDPVLIFPAALKDEAIKRGMEFLKQETVLSVSVFNAGMNEMIFEGVRSEKKTAFPFPFSKLH